jgi:antirestriction protein ArdC
MTKKKTSKNKHSSADIYADVTARIIEAIEAGCAPWQRPWERHGPAAMPTNGYGRPYSGINVCLLWAAAAKAGYCDPRWMTYNQAKKQGGQVKRGERATAVVLWKQITVTDEAENQDDEKSTRQVWIIKTFNVFNAEQVEGLGEYTAPTVEPTQADVLIASSGADIRHGGGRAFYNPGSDFIRMPRRDDFDTEGHYRATVLHELVHWTGLAQRLDRDLSGRFGDDAYAAEELIAELGAAFLCAQLGVVGEHFQHASYVDAWLRVLKADSRAIVTAASAARKAATYLMELAELQATKAA